jgi:esterase FrsA
MNDVAELKQFVVAHARAQGIGPARYRAVLERVRTDEDGTPGSWVHEWTRAGERRERDGDLLDATRHYTMARFPYTRGDARREALERSVAAFDKWRAATAPGIERLDLDLPEGRVRCWAAGLSATEPRPLLLVSGGIVSAKEQWAQALVQTARLGMAGVVWEMPGVGENPLRYDAGSWRILPALLDLLAGRARVSETYAIALSFSGHLALRAAVADQRLRGVVTAGAPVSEFFTDVTWQRRLPRITVDTLAALTGTTPDTVLPHMRDWALTKKQLGALGIPVAAIVSRRDEIIPPGDPQLLRSHVRRLRVMDNDDVHGSPRYAGETRLWTVDALLEMRGGNLGRRSGIHLAMRLLRARRALTGTRGAAA